ncbi:MAG: DUF1573 domain-containing protein [Flavobacteriaceae bacterium]
MNFLVKSQPSGPLSGFKNLFLALFLIAGTAVFAQDKTQSEPKGVFQFENETIDYGTIAHNADGVRAFKFKNVGDAPIIISNVKGKLWLYCTYQTRWSYNARRICRDRS